MSIQPSEQEVSWQEVSTKHHKDVFRMDVLLPPLSLKTALNWLLCRPILLPPISYQHESGKGKKKSTQRKDTATAVSRCSRKMVDHRIIIQAPQLFIALFIAKQRTLMWEKLKTIT